MKCYDKKEFEKNAKIKGSIVNEVSILRVVDHKNIVHFYEVFEDDESIYLVIELLYGGELFKRIFNAKIPESTIAIIIGNLAQALQSFHEMGIIHRDLKLENILLGEADSYNILKVADFGLAIKHGSVAEGHKKAGTPGYVAPEILHDMPYDTKADIFSLGVCLFIM